MNARLLFLGLVSAAWAFAYNYAYDYSGPVTSSSMTQNGSVSAWSPVTQFGGGGSLIWNPAVSGTNPNDYEVNTTLALAPFGGTYINYLRASSNAEAMPGACVGSYVSLEIVVSLYYGSNGTLATMNLNQCTSGSLATLGSFQVTVMNDSTFRTVVYSNNLLVYLDNQLVVNWGAIPTLTGTTGRPGLGGYGMSAGSGFTNVAIGHHDVVAPNPLVLTGVRSSLLPFSVSLAWQGTTDDTNGIGVAGYYVTKGVGASPTTWTFLGLYPGAELGDSAVYPSSTYTYLLYSFDFHGNYAAPASVTVTTPAATSVDPRRTGVFSTGAYWGGGGEQIDMLSGNLNFSLPLVSPQGRTGWTVPVGLSYNSQNWRQDSGTNWELGTDVGYGYGWSVQIGSITPYYLGWPNGVDHYVFTDGTGAQYRLDQNNGNIWSSLQGIYVWFDADTQELHFKNGMFWLMGCVSSAAEQDAGTMYPTIIEDAAGNQVIVNYTAATGLSGGPINSSGRIGTIQEARGHGGSSYTFSYSGTTPHLASISNSINTPESYGFTYTSNSLMPPFGYDPAYSGATTTQLTSISVPVAGSYAFSYDTAGASELLKAQFPWGGYLRWTYQNAAYAGNRLLREVNYRYMNSASSGGTEYGPYPITHSDTGVSGGIPFVHADSTLVDASGIGAKKWMFNSTTFSPAWEMGLVSEFDQMASLGGAALTRDLYNWGQTPTSLNPYISSKVSVKDAVAANTNQQLDQYGNTTQLTIYPYSNSPSPTTPVATYISVYVTAPSYIAAYMRGLLFSTTITVAARSQIW